MWKLVVLALCLITQCCSAGTLVSLSSPHHPRIQSRSNGNAPIPAFLHRELQILKRSPFEQPALAGIFASGDHARSEVSAKRPKMTAQVLEKDLEMRKSKSSHQREREEQQLRTQKQKSHGKITPEQVKGLMHTPYLWDLYDDWTVARFWKQTRRTDSDTFHNVVLSHRLSVKSKEDAWRFLERGAKAKANFGDVHFKAWQAAFSLIMKNKGDVLTDENIEACMKKAKANHDGIFGKEFKPDTYHQPDAHH